MFLSSRRILRLAGRRPIVPICSKKHRGSFSSSMRCFSALEEEPRESMPYDVLIVGGGPAGLAASIRLKQLSAENERDLSVCVIEKGSEIGSHILSGNVFDPKALVELFPEKKDSWVSDFLEQQGSHATPVKRDEFLILSESRSVQIPNFALPPQLHNHGNYVISLSQLCRWLAQQAEELGVEIYPGFAACQVLYDDHVEKSQVRGVATRDVGLDKDGTRKETFERGMELHARQTLFAEGARGSCSQEVIQTFDLDKDTHPQTYGLGIKEVWQVSKDNPHFEPGFVQHTLGYPLQSSFTDKVFGGSFLYHQEPNLILVGLVVGLDYANPYLNPYQEFQRWKTHPDIQKFLDGATCIAYGARVLNEGGFHAIPKLTFPGGALVGCSAGFLNAVKIKGSHTAIKSGMLAAEATYEALSKGQEQPVSISGVLEWKEEAVEITEYPKAVEDSWIHEELYEVRNCHAAFGKWGVMGGLVYSGLAAHVTKGREPFTLQHSTRDADKTQEAQHFEPIVYPPPDGKLTFDLLTNLQRSGTYHEEKQPCHLKIKPDLKNIPRDVSMQVFGAPEQRFCPAAVYEYPDGKELVINGQNCIHCKCCSIKMPHEYIQWTVPEGGGGPQYQVM